MMMLFVANGIPLPLISPYLLLLYIPGLGLPSFFVSPALKSPTTRPPHHLK
jgi:hypothetical protein